MADKPAPTEETLPELEIDTRAVVVFWAEDDEFPDVNMHNTTPYEAIGLLIVAAKKLKTEYALPLDDEEEEDDG